MPDNSERSSFKVFMLLFFFNLVGDLGIYILTGLLPLIEGQSFISGFDLSD